MNQAQLITNIASGTGESKATVENVLKELGAEVRNALIAGDEVTLPGLGKLSVNKKAARKGRNPSTGAEITIPAKNSPKFTAAKALKDALNA